MAIVIVMFPSPGGDYGLSDFAIARRKAKRAFKFPSPGGDYGLSDSRPGPCPPWRPPRFRPLAGITVFRTLPGPDGPDCARRVSVPWRGLRSFGLCSLVIVCSACSVFPSPGGDYGLSDWVYAVPIKIAEGGFRPLAGITVFRTLKGSNPSCKVRSVSVPWRGLRSFGQARSPNRPTSRRAFPSPGGDYGLSDRILCHPQMYGFLASSLVSRPLYLGVTRMAFIYTPKSCHFHTLCHIPL